jgi:hypothetical protein
LWVRGSIPIFLSFFLMWVFQWFLISLSVRPGRCDAIFAHLATKLTKKNSELPVAFYLTNTTTNGIILREER